ncbi:CYTH domain-containing protein [Naasia sp. SYSU D00948]|uniref:CYTH domain-containing protein n=1 Tax=Naasia sp. SYSU D00948 TaxID=2817379 RepID=UPI001B3089E3|nr:CYTH domain-containing protein [Naasia sp. SYSU D00948]
MAEDEVTSMTETERKYDVREDAPAPELSGFSVRRPERPDLLQATYYDTEDGALAANRLTLRRRSGGHDEGWHLKRPAGDGRTEHHAPLADEVPPALLELIREEVGDRRLIPAAELRTERSPIIVLDEEGRELAEVADDRVSATDLRSGVERTWREWEVELLEGAPSAVAERQLLLDRLEATLLEEGAEPAAAMSKFARATGRTALGPEGEEDDVLAPIDPASGASLQHEGEPRSSAQAAATDAPD